MRSSISTHRCVLGHLVVLLVLLPALAVAQPHDETGDDRTFQPRRFWPVLGGIAVADAVTMYALNKLWYEDEGRAGFAFYNDRLRTRFPGIETHGWLDDWHTYVQQDKLGHTFVAWHLARVVGQYGRWAGLSDAHAGVFGGTVSAVFQSQIEIFDGFAEAYGFSRTDVLANVAGGLVGGLQVAYPERLNWFTAKYSYHPSPYYDHDISSNPVFSFAGNAVKDYDGMSYWLVVRPNELVPVDVRERWPDWLALSIGYSGDGLAHPISGVDGPEHRRQYFIGVDFDFTTYIDRLPASLRPVAHFFSFIRIPAPALELGASTEWHWVYY